MDSKENKWQFAFLLRELDLHYLVISVVGTLLTIPALGRIPVGDPPHELAMLAVIAIGANACFLGVSFLGIAPWGFTRHQLLRCLVWIPTNFAAGSVLTFTLLLPRAIYSGILHLTL